MPICRHCNRKEANRPRGLCWTCYYTPGVPALYPSTSKFARRGVKDHYGNREADGPTDSPAGTEEKMRVLEERAEKGQSLWHDQDSPVIGKEALGYHKGEDHDRQSYHRPPHRISFPIY